MVFVVFLLAYLTRRRLDGLNRLDGDTLWRAWFHQGARIQAGNERSIRAGMALVVLPGLALACIVWSLGWLGFRFAAYPLELIVLVLLMGTPGWRGLLAAYSDAWGRGDMQAAWHQVQDRLPAQERGAALSPEAMHLSLSKVLVMAVFERFFLVAFWYVVGGIGAALIARGLVALAEQWPQNAARPRFAGLGELANWIPARLLSCTLGLAGDLSGWLQEARKVLPGFGRKTEEILMISANGSLTGYALDPEQFVSLHPDEWPSFGGRSLTAIRDLLNRSMLVWICGAALLVIAGVV
ncbi:MAG: AmpE protein [Marinobacter excellens HL-55]|uniref:AmpE protein n=1 Tax=Marinobacter excellens HL-55 TaxID=1305731 RepID=A0A0P8CY01_9GAMM|nr:MAG: AmpE protein [Marinobacter excellens HL-55]